MPEIVNEYKTYLFEKSRKKVNKMLLYNFLIVLGILGIIALYAIGILGIGLTLIGAIAAIIGILKMKERDDKYMGITAYGFRKEKFTIAYDHFKIEEVVIPFIELEDLVIYVEEYAGKPRDIFGVHHGGNNEVSFKHKGQSHSLKYIIKDKKDFKKVETLVDRIESDLERNKLTH
ncbi:hypothetical protein [Fulvivirga ligni]|uniref:hypothetical protein n=1 Tax=Fulvivirga ligni TaxID=2904246 RepID=UPI001F226107|nr:hypothetical protein [Fulvivirga ligni]UII20243.1 hypothetical protein LVD16_20580 [Fulvivirga ligni]